jgi:tetratricopeptide (TPR) repeat protein
MELHASKEPPTQPQIDAAVGQWRDIAHSVSGDAPDSNARKTYSHMAQAQGNFFAGRGFSAEAEQAWQLAHEMSPSNPEAVNSLYQLWKNNGRAPQAEALLNDFERNYPDQAKSVQQIRTTGVLFTTPQ